MPLPIAAPGEHPSFSPDGGKIAFSKGAEQVWTTNADGSNAIAPVPNALGHDPAWSLDGTFIAYDRKNAQLGGWFDVNVANLGGGTPAVLPANFAQWTFATWSPDGSKLAFVAGLPDAPCGEQAVYTVSAAAGGVAAPVRDYTGSVIASVGVAMPVYRMSDIAVRAMIPRVRQAAGAISAAMGHEDEPARRLVARRG